ncbi:hypothetical protein WT92_23825 [Burkholderia stagnalis]|uniref:Uncharacterized protein n=1 Tax=Burkholderia stagnalis TaxID=1503054 RepID=A0A119XX69_9BURK|nr:hypothetical protein WT35_23100 [Burkholderia stagnalis]KWA48999.1 hypothetical protein WT42_22300 [Burkholderia stagnalis]KWA61457.1 hypothetical protein WT44_16675 [Burkholderia stagnalis]KWA65791.1 hypothetical protein WT43_06135 [Burkholderia stagnalis]KWD01448.1 hypothetical protein WT45_11910 [Burkholderia stagnalis]
MILYGGARKSRADGGPHNTEPLGWSPGAAGNGKSLDHREDSQQVKVMAMAMCLWSVVSLFQARMQARTISFPDASYFESGDGAIPLLIG